MPILMEYDESLYIVGQFFFWNTDILYEFCINISGEWDIVISNNDVHGCPGISFNNPAILNCLLSLLTHSRGITKVKAEQNNSMVYY